MKLIGVLVTFGAFVGCFGQNVLQPQSLIPESSEESTESYEPVSVAPGSFGTDAPGQYSFGSSFFLQDSFKLQECPNIADGFYPECKCRYGPAYDKENNTCPNPVCPTNATANPAYPQCDCSTKGRNFAYTELLNDCYRSCPEDADGFWPDCKCDDPLAVFEHDQFQCTKCPKGSFPDDIYPNCDCGNVGLYDKYTNECQRCVQGSSGLYPICSCADTNATFNENSNTCEYCPMGSSGKIPDCVCDDGSEFDQQQGRCLECPYNSIGIYPKCACNDGGVFIDAYCQTCPTGSSGNYSDCSCDAADAVFVQELNQCVSCPLNSTGIYPDCECDEPSKYDGVKNQCSVCPQNSSQGIFPDCDCFNGYYSIAHGVCVECPTNSKGVYPDCECHEANHTFSAYINECFIACPSNAAGKHPHCKCDSSLEYYIEEDFACRNFTGRRCPEVSVGIGPHCLCIRENYGFNPSLWQCISDTTFPFAVPGTNSCPDSSERWPQCSDSIDRNALLSLIG